MRTREAAPPQAGVVHSTMWGPCPPWVRVLNRHDLGAVGVLRGLLRARRGDAILVNGALAMRDRYVDQLLAVAVRRLRPSIPLVISDATWTARSVPGESRSRWLFPVVEAWGKVLMRLANGPRTHFCFLSSEECDQFVRDTGTPPSRVHFTPFSTTILDPSQLDELQHLGADDEPYLFSGGNTLRDYDLLREAVEGAGLRLVIATTRDIGSWPAGTTVEGVSAARFLELMARSSGVVLPLSGKTRRSAGQQTYLNALLLNKPLIVTDAVGVRDYVSPERDAIVVPADDPVALRAAMRRVLVEPDERLPEMVANGRRVADEHDPVAYQLGLADLARAAAQAPPAR